jgi:hypothetical protein
VANLDFVVHNGSKSLELKSFEISEARYSKPNRNSKKFNPKENIVSISSDNASIQYDSQKKASLAIDEQEKLSVV